MARIRTIKPQFWGSASVAELSFDARLLLVGLISMADDDGRFIASHSAIAGYVFPHDNVQPARLRRWLDEIEGSEIVRLYQVGRIEYGVFPKFRRHQRVDKPQKSPLPAPPEEG
jgi:hypothetical protein